MMKNSRRGLILVVSSILVLLTTIAFSSNVLGMQKEYPHNSPNSNFYWSEVGKDSAENGGVSDNDLISQIQDNGIDHGGLPIISWQQYINNGLNTAIYAKDLMEVRGWKWVVRQVVEDYLPPMHMPFPQILS
jgi:hypothetical protein